jgi:hypothetical protein
MYSTSRDKIERARSGSPLQCSTGGRRVEKSYDIDPATGGYTERSPIEDYDEEIQTASISNHAMEQIDLGMSCPLISMDALSSGSLDPFATCTSAFPPEIVNSCLVYRKY